MSNASPGGREATPASVMVSTPAETVLEHLIESLRAKGRTVDGQEAPAAVLWTDPKEEWRPLLELMRDRLPELLVLGEYRPEARRGPAIWLRCVVDGALGDPRIPEGRAPILYLPGVARQELRAGEECPDTLKPLVELMFRGALWLHPNGNDWTVLAFLTSSKALGLDVASDAATGRALQRALPEVALTALAQLGRKQLAADDFDRMLAGDVVRDVLRWMDDPTAMRARLGEKRWAAFRNRSRDVLDFDPQTETDVAAGERLGRGDPPWDTVWERFSEAPTSYAGVAELLQRSRPAGELPFARERWPDLNDADEEAVREALSALPSLAHAEACDKVARLEKQHGPRRHWVWAQMGIAPLAEVLEPLARLAAAAKTALGGATPDDVAAAYLERGWPADAAAWEAVAAAPMPDEETVDAAVRCLLQPWLDDSARAFQAAVERTPLPGRGAVAAVEAGDDVCVLFVDGLRFDLGQRLAECLEACGCRVRVGRRWAALPTVTATAKPAVTPVAGSVTGGTLGEDFAASFESTGRPANARNLRDAMKERGYQVLGQEGLDAPLSHPARAWLEAGEIDRLGHHLQGRLARHIPEEIERLAGRIRELLDAGWKGVRVVTDHGWLLLPGGLPKVDLPKHLTASRWARAAVIAGGAAPAVPRAPWHWNAGEWFATAPGIACFNKSDEYAHGGLSVQECLTPDLEVERADDVAVTAAIRSITWRRLRCFVEVDVRGGAVSADLRIGGPSGASVAAAPKPVEDDASVSLVLAHDEHEESPLALVIVDDHGRILVHRATRVGDDS